MSRLDFRQRQLLVLLLFVAIPLVATLGIVLPTIRNFVIQRTYQQMEIVADLRSAAIETWVEEGEDIAVLTSNYIFTEFEYHLVDDENFVDLDILAQTDNHLRDWLRSSVTIFDAVISISVLHPETGIILVSTEPTFVGRDRGNEEYFIQGRNQLFRSNVQYSVGREAPILRIGMPVRYSEDAPLSAVIEVEMDASDLGDILMPSNQAGLSATGEAYLIEEYGFYVVPPSFALADRFRSTDESLAIQKLLVGISGNDQYVSSSGETVYGIYRWLPNLGLGLIVETNQNEVVDQYESIWTSLLLLELVIVIIEAFLARNLASQLVAPLRQLVSATSQFGTDNLSYRASISGAQEFQQLANSFNLMAERLQAAYENLEHTVYQRTKSLQATNESLKASESRFIAFMDNFPGTVFIQHADSRIFFANETYRVSIGHPSDDLIGKHVFELLPDIAEIIRIENEQVFSTNRPHQFATINSSINDVEAYWEIHKFPIDIGLQQPLIGGFGLDITERVRANIALELSENRYRQMFELIQLPKLIIDPHTGNILAANPAAVDFYGYTHDTLLQKNMIDINVASEAEITEKMQSIMRGETHSCEFIQCLADSSSRDMEVYSATIDYEGRKALYSIYIDVTDRNIAQQALENVNDELEKMVAEQTKHLLASEDRYRRVTELISDYAFAYHIKPDQTLVADWMTTESFERLFGYKWEPETQTYSIYHPDDVERVRADIKRVLSGENFTAQYRVITESGDIRWVEINRQAVWDDTEKRLVQLLGVARDITGRKHAELELEAISYRLRLATETSQLGIWDWDLTTDVMYWDDRMCELYGISRKMFTNDNTVWENSVHPEDFSQAQQNFIDALNTHKPYSDEFRIVLPNGAIKYLRVHATFLTKNDSVTRIVGVNLDITDLKQAESALRKALQTEQELSHLKTQIVSTASHEFRTPLTAISSIAQTIIHFYDRLSQDDILERMQNVMKQVQHLTGITGDMLQFARLQEGTQQIKMAEADLAELVSRVIRDFESQADYAGRITHDSPDTVIATFDERLMRQVLTNLIHNGLKYSDAGKPVDVHVHQDKKYVLIEVRDQGIGIPENDIKRLFDPFHRASNVGAIAGTGLGLSIVKQAIDAHAGTIDVTSIVNKVTTFSIHLPIIVEEE